MDRPRRASAPTVSNFVINETIDGDFPENSEASKMLQPVQQGVIKRCRLIRVSNRFSKLSPSYELYYQDAQQNLTFVMSARKRRQTATGSQYHISLAKLDSENKNPTIIGKLQSNFVGTTFTLYDGGQDPKSADFFEQARPRSSSVSGTPESNVTLSRAYSYKSDCESIDGRGFKVYPAAQDDDMPAMAPQREPRFSANAVHPWTNNMLPRNVYKPVRWPLRKELAVIKYEPNFMGFRGPRKMTFIIPALTTEGKRIEFQPKNQSETLSQQAKDGSNDLLRLHNKSPQWNEDAQSYVLNFSGRVTIASVKNFQIVHDLDLEYIILQFGRVSEHAFSLDFQYPLCPLQAFGIALSSFDSKLACE